MSLRVEVVQAWEILDSRGRPTLAVELSAEGLPTVEASVPSGASTGAGEAVELRDGDQGRYDGRGVSRAVAAVNGEIADLLVGRAFTDLSELDVAMRDLDGADRLSRLGANAVVGVSMAAARAFAAAAAVPLWQFLAGDRFVPRLPVPYFNVVNGGAHAANALEFQEFMIAPVGAPSVAEAVRAGAEVYAALRARLGSRGESTGLGDEGGFAPELERPEEVLALLVESVADAGYTTGPDGIALALDPAANGFHLGPGYTVAGAALSSSGLVDYYEALVDRFPVCSIEDGLAEDDWEGWAELTARLGDRVQLVGDDIFVTDSAIIRSAAAREVGNASLIKVNQIGTVSQTQDALATCRDLGYGAMISHRSGETPDTFIADLAVGSGCGQIKSGAPARGERVAKYNRLLAIARTDPGLRFGVAAGPGEGGW